MRHLIVLAAILAFPALGFSATYYVPDHYATIQGAISDVSVVDGDTIIVRDGMYTENITFLGKAITVKSENGPNTTTIDGSMLGSVVTFNSGEGSDSVIEGFAIVNGSGTSGGTYYYGGGILCEFASSPTLTGNIMAGNSCDYGGGIACKADCHPLITGGQVVGNSAVQYGAGIYGDYSDAVVRNVFLAGNKADEGGGGIYFRQHSNPIIEGCTLTGNTAPGATATGGAIRLMLSTASAHAIVRNNQIYGNQAGDAGGGMWLSSSSSTLLNNTVLYNNAGTIGGGIYFSGGAMYYNYLLKDSIVWGNNASTSDPQIHMASGTGLTVTYCDVAGGWVGTGNIDADPLFTGGPGGSFYLSQIAAGQSVDSPCVDAGSNTAFNAGMHTCWTRTDEVPDSGVVDMGYHAGPYSAHTLDSSGYQISVATGGSIEKSLLAGIANANRNYIILGSVTGTSPGTPLPGGHVVLPINWDIFTEFVITFVNTPFFSNFMGTLNGEGFSTALFDCGSGPLPSSVIGLQIAFAYGLNKPWDFASNAVTVEFVP